MTIGHAQYVVSEGISVGNVLKRITFSAKLCAEFVAFLVILPEIANKVALMDHLLQGMQTLMFLKNWIIC
jgi:hypothetical protein